MKLLVILITALGFTLANAFAEPVVPTAPPPLTQVTRQTAPPVPRIAINAPSWVLMAYPSGQVLAGSDIHQARPPASLSKLMTSYVLSNAIAHHHINLSDTITVSRKAWKTGGSKMFIRAGEKISVENLMKGMIISSGNDATISLAEHLAGSETGFVDMMNHTAKSLGLKNSHFQNPNGLPSDNQYSSAYDMALLSRALIAHFPQEYQWYQIKSFKWDGITQKNRNRLLWTNPNVDGLKTGYTKKAGYCLAGSAIKNNMRLIAIIMGAKSPRARAEEMNKLLTYGYRFFQNHQLFTQGQTIKSIAILYGQAHQLPLTIARGINLTLSHGQYQDLKINITTPKELKAPIAKNQVVGQLTISLKDKVLASRPVIAKEAILRGNVWQRFISFARSLMSDSHPTPKQPT